MAKASKREKRPLGAFKVTAKGTKIAFEIQTFFFVNKTNHLDFRPCEISRIITNSLTAVFSHFIYLFIHIIVRNERFLKKKKKIEQKFTIFSY